QVQQRKRNICTIIVDAIRWPTSGQPEAGAVLSSRAMTQSIERLIRGYLLINRIDCSYSIDQKYFNRIRSAHIGNHRIFITPLVQLDWFCDLWEEIDYGRTS